MAVYKCKMCGATLQTTENQTVAICGYCDTPQTLPKLTDEHKINLYERANHFRRNNEFDKAMSVYESILNEDKTDAESYWSLVLCRYGIEYVEEPTTGKIVPTINRAQYTSVFMDEDYKSAIRYADAEQKSVYEAEAKAIDEIQKGILEISQNEEPFDVFICYKETDSSGKRTPDSVLATELYRELEREGFNVFFSRITLEDKLGEEYEPYIFAALNSAKVMVVLGTKPENFESAWVRNEWSRYLSLIKNGERKTLIPAYKDMDPYNLPEEFSNLQAQDMSKLGFMQDLIRGISKIVGEDEKSAKNIDGKTDKKRVKRKKRIRKPRKKIKPWVKITGAVVVLVAIAIVVLSELFPIYKWDDVILKSKLPQPFSQIGDLQSNYADHLYLRIKYTSFSEYEAYVHDCIENGYFYIIESTASSYTAFNSDGCELNLDYSEYDEELVISLDARVSGVFKWSNSEFASTLPIPNSNKGSVLNDYEGAFEVYVGDITKTEYEEYISECEANGFDEHIQITENVFYAENKYGKKLTVEYFDCDLIHIDLTESDW